MTTIPPSRPGLRDVAARAGVSHQTVSRVFKGHPAVAPATRDRVLAAADELGFRPNHAARALATGRSRTIGVVSFDALMFGTASIINSVEQSARAVGYFTSVVSLESEQTIDAATGRLRDQGVDGLVVIPGFVSPADALRHVPADLPAVVVGPTRRASSVVADHRTAVRTATTALLRAGHRTVHHLPGPDAWHEARERRKGWAEALAGTPAPDPLPGDWSAGSGYERGRLLAADPEVTAVVAGNDQIALGLLRALHEAGRSVPDDVAVVGFDDMPESAFFYPPLTTIRQDFAALGRECIDLLIARLADPAAPLRRRVIPSELVVRATTGPGF